MKKIIIAIDGYSSTGKSTVASQLAEWLGYVYVDTGAMYRAITLFAMENDYISNSHFDIEGLVSELPNISLEFRKNDQDQQAEIFLNGINVGNEIRHLSVSRFVSPIASVSQVRKKLVQQQQLMGLDKGIVMDGRDIGTVVFPNAELKIFMNASPAERAQRRFLELQQKGDDVTFEEVLANVKERDHIDSHRQDSPLRKAEDAIEIDNSEMNQHDQFHVILQLAKDRIYGRI